MFASLPKHTWCFLVAPFVMVSALAAQAVAPATSYGPPPYYGYGGMGYGWGGGWGGGWGAGSTPMGSYLSGMGQAVRAQGQYNLMTSEAAINLQEADKRAMENQLQWTNTYFEMRKINQANRFPPKDRSRSQADWVRIANENAPQRLTPSQLDPVTGKIAWPPILQGEEFQQDRETLDQLFAHRAASHGAVGMDAYQQIRSTVNDAQAKLKSQARELGVRNYSEAKGFLSSLAREADFSSS